MSGAFRSWLADVLRVTEQHVRPPLRVFEMLEQIGVVQQRGGPTGSVQPQDLNELNIRLGEVRKAMGNLCDNGQCSASWGSYAHAADCPKAKAAVETLKG